MIKISSLVFLLSINIMAQLHLSKNWVLFNKDNSQINSNLVIKILEDKNTNYWISTVNENNDSTNIFNGILQSYCNGIWTTFDSINSPFNHTIITDISETIEGKLLFGTEKNGLYIKDGNVWDSLNTNNSPLPDNFIFRIQVDKQNRYWLGIPNYGIAVYDNGDWIFYNDQNSFNGIGDLNFIEVDRLDIVWIGTDYYGLYYFDGNSWVKKINGLFTGGPFQPIVGLKVDSLNQKWLSIYNEGGGSKIAKILNDGSIMYFDSIDIGFAFSLLSYDGIVIDKDNVKYFGTTDGLLRFDDVNWTMLDSSNSPIPSNWFGKGFVDSKNNKIYSLSSFYSPSYNYGVIFYNEDSVLVTSLKYEPHILPNNSLSQNYPNPFNPVTKIKYSLLNSDFVQIRIFNTLGKEIKNLINEYQQAGTYEIKFDANEIPSGVYFYRIITGHYSETKKMLLLR